MRGLFVILAVLFGITEKTIAAENGPSPETQRSATGARQAILTQAEVVTLAKASAKQEKGKEIDTYELKSVVFDPQSGEWTVSFAAKPPKPSEPCFLVVIKDDTRETKTIRCR